MDETQFLKTILTGILTRPDEIRVDRSVDERGVLLQLSIAQEDMGVVIGKQGVTAQAIKRLLYTFGAKNNMRLNLKILDPRDGG